jgi:hypothetical protein
MKRTGKILFIAGVALIFLSIAAIAQEKKEQQKIKIVVADKEGTKVVVDTTFAGGTAPDSITLKDGNVIYIKSGNSNLAGKDDMKSKNKNVYVTVTDNDNGDKKITKEITVIDGDSAETGQKEDGTRVIVMSDGKALADATYNVTVSSDVKTEGKGNNKTVYYYVNSNDGKKGSGEKFDIEVNSDAADVSHGEKSSYVIAKDGMVITIEGGSEEKVKEMAGVIEAKLGIKKDSKTVKK